MMVRRVFFMVPVFILCWFVSGRSSVLHAQISVVINSLADDADAHPWDDPGTPDIDESRDGIIQDMAGRKTFRAAIEEAWNMNDGAGEAIDITLNMSGVLALDGAQGANLSLPPGSHLHGNNLTTIEGGDYNVTVLDIGGNTTVDGINFRKGQILLGISGDGNVVSGNVFEDASINCMTIGGNSNIIGRGNIIFKGGIGAILLAGNDNVVKGNTIGLNANGDSVGGTQFGIQVFGDNTLIGGTDPDDRNIISAHSVSGVAVAGITGQGLGTTIIGNYIGTDPTGTKKRSNAYGVQVLSGGATIGGASEADRNVITGNKNGGIETRGEALAINIIGNYIGVDPSGLPLRGANGIELGNGDGIDLSPGSFDVLVEDNIISYNGVGIEVLGLLPDQPSWNHRIRGNIICQITIRHFESIRCAGKGSRNGRERTIAAG